MHRNRIDDHEKSIQRLPRKSQLSSSYSTVCCSKAFQRSIDRELSNFESSKFKSFVDLWFVVATQHLYNKKLKINARETKIFSLHSPFTPSPSLRVNCLFVAAEVKKKERKITLNHRIFSPILVVEFVDVQTPFFIFAHL